MSALPDFDREREYPPNGADLLDRIQSLGGIDPRRVLLRPLPGTATVADLLRYLDHSNSLYELVDGTLVEKCMGALEGRLGGWIIHLLDLFLEGNDCGELFAADSPFLLMRGLVRLPDVTFIRREQLPGGQIPSAPVPAIAPDLAVEVLSEGNTLGEMRRKRKEYFLAGTTLVWQVDPRRRVVVVYTAPEVSTTLTEADTLDGGTVLPGLQLPVRRVFERLPPVEPAPARRTRKKKT